MQHWTTAGLEMSGIVIVGVWVYINLFMFLDPPPHHPSRLKALLGVLDGLSVLLMAGLRTTHFQLRYSMWYDYQRAYDWPIRGQIRRKWRNFCESLSDSGLW